MSRFRANHYTYNTAWLGWGETMPDYTTIRVEKSVRDDLVKVTETLGREPVNMNEAVKELLAVWWGVEE